MMDKLGREITYLRLSLTERCTLRCDYCRAEEGICPKADELSAGDLIRIADACAILGIRKIRLTGGEPLLRRDLLEIIEGLVSLEGIEEVSLTTNGQMLPGKVDSLKKAGLKRLNISLDSLDPTRYHQMTGGDLNEVLQGIDETIEAGLFPVKINTVLIRGKNDVEVDDFIEFIKFKPVDVRFIELMPIGILGQQDDLRVLSDRLVADRPFLKPAFPRSPNQVSEDFVIDGYAGRVGFISPISHKFCPSCNRIRIMSDGMLRPCLGNNQEVSLLPALEGSREELIAAIRKAIFEKPAGHHFDKGFVSIKNMSEIGG